MTNTSVTPPSSEHRGNLNRLRTPRRQTLERLRQFARAYQPAYRLPGQLADIILN